MKLHGLTKQQQHVGNCGTLSAYRTKYEERLLLLFSEEN